MTTDEESPGTMAERHASASFADRLNYLFATVHPADRKPYSNQEVAATITATGESISQQYLWLLRTGKRDNPTKRHLEAIAAFFGVPGAYFLDEAAANDLTEQLELLKAARDAQVRETMMRA